MTSTQHWTYSIYKSVRSHKLSKPLKSIQHIIFFQLMQFNYDKYFIKTKVMYNNSFKITQMINSNKVFIEKETKRVRTTLKITQMIISNKVSIEK